MDPPELATVQALRQDLALQIARFVQRSGASQVAAAKTLGIPQPTLSKIANAQVLQLSLELLIRIAVRAQLPLLLQTGKDPSEAGVFVSGTATRERAQRSRLAYRARDDLAASAQRLTLEQRLDAQLKHSELLAALHEAGKGYRAVASGVKSRPSR
jgi:predicted XRE-type DNA-binding protein